MNGHGSNVAPLDLASREALFRHPAHLFASVSWWELGDVRDVAIAEGPATLASHACAFETSLMMALAPELVRIDRLEPGEEFPTSPHIWRDTLGRVPERIASTTDPPNRAVEWLVTQWSSRRPSRRHRRPRRRNAARGRPRARRRRRRAAKSHRLMQAHQFSADT